VQVHREYEIEYKYDYRISKQMRFQSLRSSMLLICRERGSVNEIDVIYDNLRLRSGIEKSYSFSISYS